MKNLLCESKEGFDQVAGIIQNLREFSRIDQATELEFADLNSAIRSTVMVARHDIEAVAKLELNLGEIFPVYCHVGQVNQVILNVLMNAIQALRQSDSGGHGVIVIRTWQQQGMACCSIQDNGPGIPLEISARVFEPFFTTKPVGEGTGLGLSVSYDIIVNKHNGRMRLDSVEGQGCTLVIELPIGGETR